MSPISILHASRDEALGAKIAAALAHAGHSAQRLSADPGDRGPDADADGEGAAIVVWTHATAKLARLHRQAFDAMERGALIPVAVGGALPPGGFENLPPVDLSGWTGAPDDPRWRFVLEEIQLTNRRMGVEDADVWAAAQTAPQIDDPGFADDQDLWTPAADLLAPVAAGPSSRRKAEPLTPPPVFLQRSKPKRRFSAKEVAIGATMGLVAMTVLTAVLAPIVLPGPAPVARPQSAENAAAPPRDGVPDPSAHAPSVLASLNAVADDTPSTDIVIPPAPAEASPDDVTVMADTEAREPADEAPAETPAPSKSDAQSAAAEEPPVNEAPGGDAMGSLIAAISTEDPSAAPAGDYFRDCADCPDMAALPAGSFQMGAQPGEVGAKAAEYPQRAISFANGFAIGVQEVTYEEWDACVADGGCAYAAPDHGWGRANRPVVSVSHGDALSYTAWLSKKTGKAYRLPTEAEWEYAARAGSTAPFSFGRTVRAHEANYNGEYPYSGEKETFRERTMPVGSFAPNAFGLYDMHGNVWEWTADCWAPSHAGAPSGGGAVAAGECSKRVLKGGAWNTGGWRLRSAHRIGKSGKAREFDNGFRVARDL